MSNRVDRDVVYGNAGGVALEMDIYYPANTAGRLPALVFLHGGGWRQGNRSSTAGFTDLPGLVQRGYLVATIEFRLAPQHKFPAQIEDAKCAIRFLRANAAEYGLDPDRIGVWGSSSGGHLAALVGLAGPSAGFDSSGGYFDQPSHVAAVVDMFGPTNVLPYVKESTPQEHVVFGVLDRSTAERASPVTYVSKDAPPFLIFHGDRDPGVPISQSQELYERLIAVGAKATLVIVKNAGHVFRPVGGAMDPSREQITEMVGDFFDCHLG